MDAANGPTIAHWVYYICWFYLFLGATLQFVRLPDRRHSYMFVFTAGIAVSMAASGATPPSRWGLAPGLLCLAASVGLFTWARHTIARRFFSYLGSEDTPQFVCTDGPYARIRHPFYSSYILALLAGFLLFPNAGTAGGMALSSLSLYLGSRFEEGKFMNSPLASDYREYMQRTGRFLPKLSR